MAMNPAKEESTKTESASYMLPDGNVIEVSLSSLRLISLSGQRDVLCVIGCLVYRSARVVTRHQSCSSVRPKLVTSRKVYTMF